MKPGRLLVALGMAFVSAVQAASPESSASSPGPFQSIIERNVFGLRPPPPPPAPPEPPKPPIPNLTLTGIMTGLGKKRALMETVLPVKPPEQPKKSFFTLAEGERDGEIEVLKIEETSVQVRNYGVVTNLTFEANGVKTASQGVPPSKGPNPFGVPGRGPAMPGNAGFRPGPPPFPGQANTTLVQPPNTGFSGNQSAAQAYQAALEKIREKRKLEAHPLDAPGRPLR